MSRHRDDCPLPPLEQLFEEAFEEAIELGRPDLVERLVEAVAAIVGSRTLGGDRS